MLELLLQDRENYPMSRLPNADFLDKALQEASTPALLMSMMHMLGDTAILDEDIRPQIPPMLELQGGLGAEDRARVRTRAREVITDFFSEPKTPVMDFGQETTERMLAFAVGQDNIGSTHQQMMLEELNLSDADPKQVRIKPAAVSASQLKVAIIGAGMSGLLLGMRLKEAGIAFTIFEKNAGIGGTWFENRYPGCRVDISSHAYSYSFEKAHSWDHHFGQQPELEKYFNDVAKRHELFSNIEFNTVVESASYDQASQFWMLTTRNGNTVKDIRAQVMISAVGQLNQPRIPDIPGRENFAGAQMHTAQWDNTVELKGKRVAVVGAGATAFQMVPELAADVAELTVFQRTPQWMFANPGYHDSVSDEHNWCIENLPGYGRWFRILNLWPMTDKSTPTLAIDPDWDDNGLSCGPINQKMRKGMVAYISSQVEDPKLLEKVIPQYPPFGTRILQDNGSWLATLQQDHVTLISDGVASISADGLESTRGEKVDVDVIIWATGFQTDRFVWPMKVTGSDNLSLAEEWAETPKSYLGITVPGFPNFYCLYGPNTNNAHSTNIIFIAECQVRYIMSALKLMIEEKLSALECKSEVADDYEQRLRTALEGMVWSYHSVHGFYRLGETGRVAVNMPWDASDYWQWTKQLNPDDYQQYAYSG